jgi:hypothetical protein
VPVTYAQALKWSQAVSRVLGQVSHAAIDEEDGEIAATLEEAGRKLGPGYYALLGLASMLTPSKSGG